ncbi:GGDEF domain-containing protein [Zobellella endophytica]|uniref:GGDEF domain-containing protein n=1 Tax=Zobellella endophytica TaxID=2116700 RepID=A0A2P7R6B5_9GAMM|nr:EAL domain-containing protein [Zobellella endophytica]PSJ45761.1 GGDEF domain-containing protein [Zobellella endophytica]
MQLPALNRVRHSLCFFRLDPQFRLHPLTPLPVADILLPDATRSLLSQLDAADRRQLEQLCAAGRSASLGLTIEGHRWQCHLAPAEQGHWLLSADMSRVQHDDRLGLMEWRLQQDWARQDDTRPSQLPVLMDTLIHQLQADRVILWRHYEAEELLRPLYSQGLPFTLSPVRAERRYLRTLLQRGGLSYSHCAQQPLLGAFDYLARDGIQHRLDVPLPPQQGLAGLLSLEYSHPRPPVKPADMQFVSAIAGRLATLLGAPATPPAASPAGPDIAALMPLLCQHTGQDFFNQLMLQLAQLCGADMALVGLQQRRIDQVRVLSCYEDGRLQPPFSYHLAGTPCAFSHRGDSRLCVYPGQVAELFPQDSLLREKGLQAYVGLSLRDETQRPMGILALLFRQPLAESAAIQSLLEQLEPRVRAELLRRRDQEALMVAAAAFETQEGLFITDNRLHIQQVNQAFASMSGYHSDDLTGKSALSFRAEDPHTADVDAIIQIMAQKHRWQGEQRLRRADGQELAVSIRITEVRDGLGMVHYVCCVEDISGQKADKQRIEQMAYFDDLTGLHNRRFMVEHIQHTVALAEHESSRGALLLLDLDDFKNINDSLGYATGDALLTQVAERLKAFAAQQEGSSLARIASDEFVLLCPNLGHGYSAAKTRAEQLANALRELFLLPFQLDKLRLHLSASLGVSLFPVAGLGQEEYMRQADTANHMAKRIAPGSHVFFSQEMAEEVQERLRLSNALQQALKNEELTLYFQPQLRVSDAQLLGVEVLLRWHPPGGSPIPPGHFIPVAEETSLICDIGDWVLQQSCRRIQQWPAGQALPGRVSVNISARHFHSPDFVARLSALLQQYPACRNRLTLEVTEGVILENLQESRTRMSQIKALGVYLSIDDFGTGYSSFAYLRELPVDELKLDRSFIQHIDTRPQDKAIIACLLELAVILKLAVVAEGVETEQQLASLSELNCLAYQGYLAARPMPEPQLMAWLAQQG